MSKTPIGVNALAIATGSASRTRQRRAQFKPWHLLLHLVLTTGAIFMLLPFVWMVSTSLKAQGDVFLFPPKWIPDPIMWSNYVQSWTIKPMGLAFLNSLKISVI